MSVEHLDFKHISSNRKVASRSPILTRLPRKIFSMRFMSSLRRVPVMTIVTSGRIVPTRFGSPLRTEFR